MGHGTNVLKNFNEQEELLQIEQSDAWSTKPPYVKNHGSGF